MKKYIGVLWFCMAVVTSAQADTTIPWTKEGCESVKGTWLTAHKTTDSGCDAAHCNGKSFCRSNVTLNWFNALVWCKSIGHNLVSWENLCPGTPLGPNNATGACPNVKGVGGNLWGWTSAVWTSPPVLTVNLSSGAIDNDTRIGRLAGYIYAVCEE